MLLYTLTGLHQLIHLSPPYKWDPVGSVEMYEIWREPENSGSIA